MSLALQREVTRFRYRLYGLDIASDFDLGDLPTAAPGGCVLRIVRASIPAAGIDRSEALTFIDDGDCQVFAWGMVGIFRIVADDRIEVDPNPGVADSLVALPLLGTVIAALLQRRGLMVLHASAASVEGQAVVLLGHKGAGKSTTAGALLAAGHTLLADDVVAVEFGSADAPRVLPAAAQLRLWDDSSSRLTGAGIADRGRLHDAIDKSLYSAPSAACDAAPLVRLYLLGRSIGAAGTHPMSAREAIDVLLNQSYMARFGERGFGATMPTHFLRVAQLARSGKVRILAVPEGLGRLGEIAPMIERDLASA